MIHLRSPRTVQLELHSYSPPDAVMIIPGCCNVGAEMSRLAFIPVE